MRVFDTKGEMQCEFVRTLTKQEPESILGCKKGKNQDSVIFLDNYLFREFLETNAIEDQYSDVTFSINEEVFLRSNRALLALNSQYFTHLLSGNYQEQHTIVAVPFQDPILFQIMLYYLTSGFVVTSKDYGH